MDFYEALTEIVTEHIKEHGPSSVLSTPEV